MKLASLKHGRDGRLIVVSDDLAWYAKAHHLAPTLQAALDGWERAAPQPAQLAVDLAGRAVAKHPFDPRNATAPLPRADQWADGSAYVNQVALVRQVRGAEQPHSFWHDAGTIVRSGMVSDRDAGGGLGKPIAEGGLGYSCIAEVRAVGTVLRGAPETPFLRSGDTVSVRMEDEAGRPIFGKTDQRVG